MRFILLHLVDKNGGTSRIVVFPRSNPAVIILSKTWLVSSAKLFKHLYLSGQSAHTLEVTSWINICLASLAGKTPLTIDLKVLFISKKMFEISYIFLQSSFRLLFTISRDAWFCCSPPNKIFTTVITSFWLSQKALHLRWLIKGKILYSFHKH